MSKILQIAWREFAATVLTKGFLIGLLLMPFMIGMAVVLMPMLINVKSPAIHGGIAVLDRSGEVVARLREQLDPKVFAQRRRAIDEKINAAMPAAARALTSKASADARVEQSLSQVLGQVPEIEVSLIEADAGLNAAKSRLLLAKSDQAALLAVLVVHSDAVQQPEHGKELGTYDLFVSEKLDDRLISDLREAMKTAIVDARLAVRQLDAGEIRALTRLAYVRPQMVTKDGAQSKNEIANKLLPMAFMMLILISVMTAGQQLMTSTIEEKSSRVVEVLLAAVSPTELMAGKILGQMGVGLLMLLVYGGLVVISLLSFSLLGMIDPWLLMYLLIFFVIAFTTLSALMAAIGAAVNELREAQALLTPVILVAVLPSILWMPISNDPDSIFATVLSLVPPISPFVMMLRMASSTPPPMWQVWLSIAIGIAGMLAAIWVAGKVFRIGLLMHGKPPNLMTLIRWVRMS
ncbi:MAG: ABC transporter permease [Pseudomonadota bacterium]|nr:ABC transporter permease [Pseudomonadota bacterium]